MTNEPIGQPGLPHSRLTLKRMAAVAVLLIAAGAVLSLLGLLRPAWQPRLTAGWLWAFTFTWTVLLGCLFFVALQHVTASVWSVVIRRAAEMLARPIWILALLFVPIALIVAGVIDVPLFPWTGPEPPEHWIGGKTVHLHPNLFVARGALYFIVWIAFARFFVDTSIHQDETADPQLTDRMRRYSTVFMLLFALTGSLAAVDWLMSLAPAWYSTIFPVYVFAGSVVAALAAITLATIWLRSLGLLGDGIVTADHLYSLGGLLFAFSCFWAYIAFSQYMLIWYGNIPEETVWFIRRLHGPWYPLTILLAAIRFVAPFLLLLPRRAKTAPRLLVGVCALLLLGQLLDLYWLIAPELPPGVPRLGLPELAPLLLMLGIVLLYVVKFVGGHRMLPVGDPLFEESRHFHL